MISRRAFVSRSAAALVSAPLVTSIPLSGLAQGAPQGLPTAIPLDALDGEKLRVNLNGERVIVRLIGNDAPEPEVDDNTTECGFLESRQALLDAVTGKTLLLESDEEDKDGKDRLLRHVWLVNADGSDGGLLNEQLLQYGWVTLTDEDKNMKYAERYVKMAAEGQANKTGLYATCESFHQEIPRHGGHDDPALLGEAIQVKGVVVSLDNYYYSAADALGSPAPGGYMYLIASVTIRNVRETGNFTANSNGFAAKDLISAADYDDEFAFLNAPLSSIELSPDEFVSGEVAIEVQVTATQVRLKYNIEGDYSLYWLTPVV